MLGPGAMDYETLGIGYADKRRPDPRIAARIRRALGDVRSVVNVGAGAGSYEPTDLEVMAVEPSARMIAQRRPDAAPVRQASAEALPFADGAYDAAMAVLTLHHWADWRSGVAQMRRVARRRVVLLTWDPEQYGFWLDDYLPAIAEVDGTRCPTLDALGSELGEHEVQILPIPHDCTDGFLGAYWRRPTAYLDPEVRRSISVFTPALPGVEAGLRRLAADLADGRWERRYGHLRARDELDLGYRLVVADVS